MSRKFLELYSGNRDRHTDPLVADFTVPFGPSFQNISPNQARDAVVDGAIYYTFTLAPNILPDYMGNFQPGSSVTGPLLDPNQIPLYSLQADFYVGFTLLDTASGEQRLVRSYDPTTGYVSLDYPFPSLGPSYQMYAGFPTENTIFIPSVDDNGNVISDEEQAYTGYYVVFETPNPLYSNADNSNIFSRKISYYDRSTHLAYFDKPLPFNYNAVQTPQTFTLRQSLPTSRWELQTPSYLCSQVPANPQIGPLQGSYIITLPPGASDVDNYYRGKFVYFANNQAEYYSPPLPNPKQQEVPIPYVFYPIYGSYYIQAYNGATRQLSVQPDCLVPGVVPTFSDTGYTAASFVAGDGIASITESLGEYTAVFTSPPSGSGPVYAGSITLSPTQFNTNTSYDFVFRVKKSANITTCWFSVPGIVDYNAPCVMNTYLTYEFRVTVVDAPLTIFFLAEFDPLDPADKSVTWDFFSMHQEDIINICSFQRDNFYPLDYSGTMVGLNQAVCYDLSLVSLSLPNLPLLTGSKVAFYPYIYVEFDNVTSPTAHGTNVFYSNHPESSRAMFTASVYPAASPNAQRFMAVSGSMSQTVKFKPNDNLHLRVFLPDGQLFQPILQDLQTPYAPLTRLQIQAVFAIGRSSHIDK
jgi:hypothetical protein